MEATRMRATASVHNLVRPHSGASADHRYVAGEPWWAQIFRSVANPSRPSGRGGYTRAGNTGASGFNAAPARGAAVSADLRAAIARAHAIIGAIWDRKRTARRPGGDGA